MNIDKAFDIAGRVLLGGVIAGVGIGFVAIVLAAGVMAWKVALQ